MQQNADDEAELQKRADRADQSVLFFLAGANFWEKHAKNRQKHAKTGAFLVLIFFGEKLVGANFYAFCNYAPNIAQDLNINKRFALFTWFSSLCSQCFGHGQL